MTTVGITGHQRIPEEALNYVTRRMIECLESQAAPLVGYSSLAIGADQIFAQSVLDLGGQLMAIIPCEGYEATFSKEDLPAYKQLLIQAQATVLDFPEPSERAFMAAGEEVIDSSDVIIAIWDGLPAAGLGGTADAVAHARSLGKQVVVIWPEGVQR